MDNFIPLTLSESLHVNGGNKLLDFFIGHFGGKLLDAAWAALRDQVARDKTHSNTSYNWNGSAGWR